MRSRVTEAVSGTSEAQGTRGNASSQAAQSNGGPSFTAPSISLPKGGGAIRGMGEKFSANPVTGAGSMTVPIAVSPGRSGFGPQLSLSYDSGGGNGPFGLGWNLSVPSITRKTDKGIPKYLDTEESDVFILSGSEDLVPILNDSGNIVDAERDGYRIRSYRPRTEGLFARIERWMRLDDGDIHWRSISKENLLTIYGKDEESRISDPQDSHHVFSWLTCETRDDKGNGIVYEYISDNATNLDLTQANERNRGDVNSPGRKTNRYLKRIRYGNRSSLLGGNGKRQPFLTDELRNNANWMFEVVFDYGDEHYVELPEDAEKRRFVEASLDKSKAKPWPRRADPFSSYRSGFEVRTSRLCHRSLLYHHFPAELNVQDCLVRSTEFQFEQTPVASFLTAVTQSGYVHQDNTTWLKKSLPPLEFEYSRAVIEGKVRELDAQSLDNLPAGLDNASYQWIDLDGDGVGGVLTEQADAWFYKRNLSPQNQVMEDGVVRTVARLAPAETIPLTPSVKGLKAGMQFIDLAGDGRADLVRFDGLLPGFYEHAEDGTWSPHRPFLSLPEINWNNPSLKFIDLTGDGHADILLSEDGVFMWYPSRAEAGFSSRERAEQSFDEENGPRLVFADSAQSIFLADLSGDGLTDIVRIRNGEVCYWPNLGYGRFGAKLTMDGSPWFDHPDQFDNRRIRLADIDGSGVTDIIYLHGNGVRLYFNHSGNSWSEPKQQAVFPAIDSLSSVVAADLLGNGTACLVWSSALPGNARRPMFYVDLMGGIKPHLLISSRNNFGAETRLHYATSTKFYLQDKYAGNPWVTKLPFPVHVVEKVETYDRISLNRFVTRYAYHHGYFDGEEREFRGFGLVEQRDTEELTVLASGGLLPAASNLDADSHVPPVLTRTWFHTGAFVEGGRVGRQFEREYYREGDSSETLAGLSEEQLRAQSLPDTVLPSTLRRSDGAATIPHSLAPEEVLEACRALKGVTLRQEIYALDGSDESDRPYLVSERNYTIEMLQPRAGNKHAVFFTHAREQLEFHYERTLVDVNGVKRADPRVSHALTLDVDSFGNVLRSLSVSYRRRELPGVDAPEQRQTHLVLTANRFANRSSEIDWYRAGLAVETSTYEIAKPPEPQVADTRIVPFRFEAMQALAAELFPTEKPEPDAAKLWPYEKWDWRVNLNSPPPDTRLRPIECLRTFYRKDDLTGMLPLGGIESQALPGEILKLALTPALLATVFKRKQGGQPAEDLLPSPALLLEGTGPDEAGFRQLAGAWWIPSGKVFFDPAVNVANPGLTAAQELATARRDFFLTRKFVDSFNQETRVDYDAHRLRETRIQDSVGNVVESVSDYRALQPKLIIDPNRNRTASAFDALGMVAATAVIGKEGQNRGDLLEGFDADPTIARLQQFAAAPLDQAASLLGKATALTIYDAGRFHRCGQPSFAASLARETHFFDAAGVPKVQVSFSYSDGFGREIQRKIQAEAGDAAQRQADVFLPTGDLRPGVLVRDANNKLVQANAPRRWVGTGRTVFNNKGKPVRQYEPFFSATPLYEDEREMTHAGVSSVLFYDPAERVVATLRSNHTYEKVVFDAWRQKAFDVNDTVAPSNTETGDPRTDPDIKGYVVEYFKTQPNDWQTWHALRIGNQMGSAERDAAQKAAAHANTPTATHLDPLGRVFLTVADNGPDPAQPDKHLLFATRVVLDIEGNQREVRDAKDRVVMRYDLDMLGTRIYQASIEAGDRWMLSDAKGNQIRAWDSRLLMRRMSYDALRRPAGLFVVENGNQRMSERTVYGESLGESNNHRTRVHQIFDGAGVLTFEAYDFKGNVLGTRREFLNDYKQPVNWLQNPVANDGVFTSNTSYDALNRPVTVTTPDNSSYRATFTDGNLLNRVDVNLRGAAGTTPFVTNINYNAKGQRELIVYGNGAQTAYDYDPLTFQMTKLTTTRPANPDAMASQLFTTATLVQDLRYTYDPGGNITRIADLALKSVVNNGEAVEPVCEYSYDATYRLIEARGREHVGQTGLDFDPPNGSRREYPFFGLRANPNDLQALRNYTERYEYDEVDNFKMMRHLANGAGWNCEYAYEEASLLEAAKMSNRLTRTTSSGFIETYTYKDSQGADVQGCMTAINAMKLTWDFKDQLQRVDLGGGGTAYYVYDAGGQRLRKVLETQNGARKEERFYLGRFEVYREYNGGPGVKLTRETLHVMDDKQRIALVETKTTEDGNVINAPTPLQRYQLGNHLSSASLELDAAGALICYEEYHPYGTTSFQAGRNAAETSSKRYRYTGKERDEETGFTYHGARYYAPWLRRWTSCDPSGIDDGINVYAYVSNRPVTHVDLDGRANTPIHEHLTTIVAMQYVDSYDAKRIGKAANVPDTEDYYDSVDNSISGDPQNVNRDVHVLWAGSRAEKVKSTMERYTKRDVSFRDDKIRDAGIYLLHPLQDANYHGSSFGPGMGHALTPEADLAVGEKSFDEFYRVVTDTEKGLELMRKKGIIGANEKSATNRLSKAKWMSIYKGLKRIESRYTGDFAALNAVGIVGRLAGPLAGFIGGAIGGLLGAMTGFFIAAFSGKNVLKGAASGAAVGFNLGQMALGIGVGYAAGFLTQLKKDSLRNKVADIESGYLKKQISEIEGEKDRK